MDDGRGFSLCVDQRFPRGGRMFGKCSSAEDECNTDRYRI